MLPLLCSLILKNTLVVMGRRQEEMGTEELELWSRAVANWLGLEKHTGLAKV